MNRAGCQVASVASVASEAMKSKAKAMRKHVFQFLQMNRAGCQVASPASVASEAMKSNASMYSDFSNE